MQPLSFQDLLRLGKCHELLRPLQPAAVWHSGLEHVIMFVRPRAHFNQGAAAYRWLRSVAARGSDGRRSRQSPLHRLNPLHVGCKKLASALASMDDKRMLHSFRALAPDLKQLRLADQPNDGLARAIAANEPPWRIDEAMNPLTGRKKTFGLVGRQSDVGVRHSISP